VFPGRSRFQWASQSFSRLFAAVLYSGFQGGTSENNLGRDVRVFSGAPFPVTWRHEMARSKKPETTTVYQLRVDLDGSKPPIWRRILVSADITLGDLHDIIQVIMGWDDYHMHQFIVGEMYYSDPSMELDDVEDERSIRLRDIAPKEGSKFVYEYDFGDSWLHSIRVEKILPVEPGVKYPVCVTGKRACPPDDCGGIWGYQGLLEALKDPDDPENQYLVDWVGEDFDPEVFDLDGINRNLAPFRR
jgi:hypothetical protein